MNNKKWLIIGIIACLTVLLFPIRNIYKDGGTKTYTSLVYKVISWNTLEGKTGTETKLFPDNFKSLDDYSDNPQINKKSFENNIKAISGNEISLNTLTPFSWDKLYSFAPYTSKDKMESIIGFKSSEVKETINEGMQQLLFVKAGKTVCSIVGYSENLGYAFDFGDIGSEYIMIESKTEPIFCISKDKIVNLTYIAPKLTQAEGYYEIFKSLYAEDEALNNDIKYISLDMTKAKMENKAEIIKLFESFCKENNLTLLQNTYAELETEGYIKDKYFPDGVLISFEDENLTETKLVTKASKWRSGLGAIGATYTAEKKSDKWQITKTDEMWIS